MDAQRLTHITPPAATPDQLWQRVEAAWSSVPQERTQSLFESMSRCVAAIVHPKEVPKHYYLQKSEKTLSTLPGVKKLSITRFSKVELTFEVMEPNSYLEWEFETKDRDIAFAVYFQEKTSKQSKPIEILPKQRIDTYYEPETGMYKCQKAGTYIVVFDNSYSWLRPKEIYYKLNVRGSQEIEGVGMK
ncbi:SEC14-like protein 4 [Trichonephila clavipes]|nr:SEC14-like protein 4 [Trichonephila clavipes]